MVSDAEPTFHVLDVDADYDFYFIRVAAPRRAPGINKLENGLSDVR